MLFPTQTNTLDILLQFFKCKGRFYEGCRHKFKLHFVGLQARNIGGQHSWPQDRSWGFWS